MHGWIATNGSQTRLLNVGLQEGELGTSFTFIADSGERSDGTSDKLKGIHLLNGRIFKLTLITHWFDLLLLLLWTF